MIRFEESNAGVAGPGGEAADQAEGRQQGAAATGIQAGVGVSVRRNPREAGREAAEIALRQAGIDTPDFVIVYATVGYKAELLLRSIREATGHAPLIGCSAEGIIAQQYCDESNHAVSVMVWKSDRLRFEHYRADGLKADSRAAGVEIARSIGQVPDDAKALFVLADGLSFNFDQFRDGFQETAALDRFLPILGGTAADNWQMRRTLQFLDDQIFSDGVSCAILRGEGEIAFDVSHGCVPIGHERTITRCNGNQLLEIDYKPVLEVLKEYLEPEEIDDFTKAIVNLCLGFKAPEAIVEHYDEFIIRFMPSKDDETGGVTIPTEVTPGTKVWMTRRDPDKMYAGVEQLAARMRQKTDGRQPAVVLQFDCAGRGKTMFRQDEKTRLVARLQELVGATAPWMGFFTYGEIGPIDQSNYFHNYTAVVACIY